MSSNLLCPWCHHQALEPRKTNGVWECTYCGLTCLQGFKPVPAPSPWPTLEAPENPPLNPEKKK